MLDAILQVFPLDQYGENNFVLMEKVAGDPADTSIWNEYETILHKYEPDARVSFEERTVFGGSFFVLFG